MKSPVLAVIAACAAFVPVLQSAELNRLWETAAEFKVPESVLHDAARDVLYVSNIDGEPWAKDGRGSIGKLGLDGRVQVAEWVTGLDAPKGMALRGARLYVGDLTAVVVIDVEQGRIVERIAVPGAERLNDVSADARGVVYVTDSGGKKLYAVEDGRPRVVVENLQGPNGVLAHDGKLYLLDGEALYRVTDDGKLTELCRGLEGHVDGVEPVGNGDFIVSCWRGVMYYVKPDGTRQTLLDTRAKEIHAADIGYNAATRTVYVPTFFSNTVVAYTLKAD